MTTINYAKGPRKYITKKEIALLVEPEQDCSVGAPA